MKDLYDKIRARIPGIVDHLMEQYRVHGLAKAPDYAKSMFTGPGWDMHRKNKHSEFEVIAWRMAFCEVIQVLMESDEELESRIDTLENK